MAKPTITCLIPARMSSSRFPGKPLAGINDEPMISHVYHQALKWKGFDRVYVVTPNKQINQYCFDSKIPSVNITPTPNDCLDCAALGLEVLLRIWQETDRYVILQGDEPLFDCSVLDSIDFTPEISNLFTFSKNLDDVTNNNIVKVLTTVQHKAIYFSRTSLPWTNSRTMRRYHKVPLEKQLGIYIFSPRMLRAFHHLKPTALEENEGIGLNRLIENGVPIQMQYSPHDSISVDIPSDIQKIESIIKMENEKCKTQS